jgi:intein-encoded DNA endonuclease-like protein
MREEGVSYDDIAAYLTLRVGVRFGRETVRRWFNKQS